MDDGTAPDSHDRFPVDLDALRGRPDGAVLAAIALGGMAGASARYAVNQWLPPSPGGVPWATFWVNVSGSLVLGLLLVVIAQSRSRLLRPLLATGVLGAFTTMSTYQVETVVLVKDGHAGTAVLYSVGSVIVGLVAAYAGLFAGRRIFTGRSGAPA